jgi:hypothetical protein
MMRRRSFLGLLPALVVAPVFAEQVCDKVVVYPHGDGSRNDSCWEDKSLDQIVIGDTLTPTTDNAMGQIGTWGSIHAAIRTAAPGIPYTIVEVANVRDNYRIRMNTHRYDDVDKVAQAVAWVKPIGVRFDVSVGVTDLHTVVSDSHNWL